MWFLIQAPLSAMGRLLFRVGLETICSCLVEPAGKITASSQNCLFKKLPSASFTPGLSCAAPQEQTQLASPLGLFLPAQPQTGKSSSLMGVDGEEALVDPIAGLTVLPCSSQGEVVEEPRFLYGWVVLMRNLTGVVEILYCPKQGCSFHRRRNPIHSGSGSSLCLTLQSALKM